MTDLFAETPPPERRYSAQDIEVLEGLEPVRRRPGMYIGGTDESALHHLAAELLDNAMDEAVAGHAGWIALALGADGTVTVRDNGRGIPIDEHPRFPGRSALEVILTTLHSGGKFSEAVYQTAGGLHGVGLSVVNALSDRLTVEVARDRQLWRQDYARGAPLGPLEPAGQAPQRRGTLVRFHPDPQIFGEAARFRPDRLFRMARAKAYLHRGVEVRWSCAPELADPAAGVEARATLRFPGGLADLLQDTLGDRPTLSGPPFAHAVSLPDEAGRLEWAVAWPEDEDGLFLSYCNAVPTPGGGTHEAGLRAGLQRSLRAFAELSGHKRAGAVTAEDICGGAVIVLSLFLRSPQFQGQTKERLASPEAARLVEAAVKDHFDHWLSGDPSASAVLLERLAERADERQRRRHDREHARKSAPRKLRLPGQLTDCSRMERDGTEIFLVEGDSAGGSAKAARDRETQAILPLRGKIMNVASASADKLAQNKELADLALALGCGTRAAYDRARLRYERVIIMTDADVDGAHIASLLITYFFREMRGLIADGHLFLAQPPLYRLQKGATVLYARDDAHRAELEREALGGRGALEISRFKGLGEMPAVQLRETTMAPASRMLLRVTLDEPADGRDGATEVGRGTAERVEALMGRKPESRLRFIQDRAPAARDLDV